MAENNKMGPNLQAGAGFLAKRVQKSLNRAQEKVSQGNQLSKVTLGPFNFKNVGYTVEALSLVWDDMRQTYSSLFCHPASSCW